MSKYNTSRGIAKGGTAKPANMLQRGVYDVTNQRLGAKSYDFAPVVPNEIAALWRKLLKTRRKRKKV